MTQTQTQIICGIAELLKEIRANAPIDDVIRAEKIGNWRDNPCYYVSVIDGDRFNLLAGAFRTHEQALEMVDAARNAALEYGDPKAWFYAYGTCKMENGYNSGILNKKLGI